MCGYFGEAGKMTNYTLHLGDCLEYMRGMEPGSVDCVCVDLPYFEVVKAEWDNQWATRADYLEWVVTLAREWKRITKDNSSVFIFCDEKMEAYIQVRLDELFLLLNKIVWFKRNNLPQKNAHLLRSFAPMTERAIYYANYSDNTAPSGFSKVIKDARIKSGMSCKDVAELGGFYGNVNHGGIVSNWESGYSIPSFEQWEVLVKILEIDKVFGILSNQHRNIRQEYELMRRPFNADSKTWDVIELPIVSAKENTEHPTTKPTALYQKILSAITNPGQLVLDCCMGSGTCGEVAIELGRRFVGCEIDPAYFAIAKRRIEQASAQPLLIAPTAPKPEQAVLSIGG